MTKVRPYSSSPGVLKEGRIIKRVPPLVCMAGKVNGSKRITNAQGGKRFMTECIEDGHAIKARQVAVKCSGPTRADAPKLVLVCNEDAGVPRDETRAFAMRLSRLHEHARENE